MTPKSRKRQRKKKLAQNPNRQSAFWRSLKMTQRKKFDRFFVSFCGSFRFFVCVRVCVFFQLRKRRSIQWKTSVHTEHLWNLDADKWAPSIGRHLSASHIHFLLVLCFDINWFLCHENSVFFLFLDLHATSTISGWQSIALTHYYFESERASERMRESNMWLWVLLRWSSMTYWMFVGVLILVSLIRA